MAIPCSTRDLENVKFVECPADSGNTAVRTTICQEDNTTIRVELDESGIVTNQYAESSSVAGLATVTILSYTVPVGKVFKLKTVEASGGNKAIYTIEVNSTVIAKRRSYFTEFNVEFELGRLKLIASDIVDIKVENIRVSTADFNTNLIGVLDDA